MKSLNLNVSSFFVGLIMIATSCSVARAQTESMADVVPIEGVQERFIELGKLALDTQFSPEVKARYDELISELSELVGNDQVLLIKQWFYFYATYIPNLQGSRKSDMAVAMQSAIARFEPTRSDWALALYPFLNSTDEKFLEILIPFLNGADWMDRGTVDFGIYESILKDELEREGDIPQGLVKYMYKRAPGVALITIMRIDNSTFAKLAAAVAESAAGGDWPPSNIKKLELRKEHPSEVLVSELEHLSVRPEWWIQLFVAEFVTQVPNLRQESLLSNLAKSNHPLVKQVLSEPGKYSKKLSVEVGD